MSTLTERFDAFHAENPHVYEHLRALAFRAVEAGQTKLGIAQLFEVCRWELLLRTSEKAPHLNNDYRAPYARLLMQREPALEGMFETRRSAADQVSSAHSPEPAPTAGRSIVGAGSGQPAPTPPSVISTGYDLTMFDDDAPSCGPSWNDPANPYSEAA